MGFVRGMTAALVGLCLSAGAAAQTSEIAVESAPKSLSRAKADCRRLPELPRALCLGQLMLDHRRASLALDEASQALALEPRSATAHRIRGEALAMLGKEGVEAAFAQARSDAQEAVRAELGLGRFWLRQGRRDDGILALRRALALSPNHPEVLLDLGKALGATEEARGLLERAVRERPTSAEAALALADVRRALGDAAGAESAYRSAANLDPSSSDAQLGVAALALARGRTAEARRALHRAQALVPNDPRAALLRAELHAKTGELEDAIAQYRRAGDLDPGNPEALTRAAELLVAEERFSVAAGYLERVLAQHPDSVEALMLYGDVMARRGDKFMARKSYRRALATGRVEKKDVESKLSAL